MTKQGTNVRWDATCAFGFTRNADSVGDVFFHVRDYRGATATREGVSVVLEEIRGGGKGRVPRRCAARPARPPIDS